MLAADGDGRPLGRRSPRRRGCSAAASSLPAVAPGSLPLSMESGPLESLASDPKCCFAHYDYALLRGIGVASALKQLRRWSPVPQAPLSARPTGVAELNPAPYMRSSPCSRGPSKTDKHARTIARSVHEHCRLLPLAR